MSFDEWIYNGASPKAAWDYQQSKIDSLHKNIEALHVESERIQKQYSMMFEGVQGRQKTIDELQKRIDEVGNKLKSIKASSLRPSHHDYDRGWRDCAITVLSDLKGEK